MVNRINDFSKIKECLANTAILSTDDCIVVSANSLETLKLLPKSCISLILTDPPYHSTKKDNIFGDKHFAEDEHYIDWMRLYSSEWDRILRRNGSLYCFCASEMASRLEVMLSDKFNILSQIVWTKPNEPGFDGWKQKMKKEALRQWYAHSERIIFAEPAAEGNLHRSHFANFLRKVRKEAGITAHTLAELTGSYGKVNHGGSVSNWETGRNIPSREQYEKICSVLMATDNVKTMPEYEDVIRPFYVDSTKEFCDVWTFPSVRPYKGKHPAEKPLSMLEHAIEASSFPGDIVMDCFGGSGNTAIAALSLGRKSIIIEIEPQLALAAAEKLEEHMATAPYNGINEHLKRTKPVKSRKNVQLKLV